MIVMKRKKMKRIVTMICSLLYRLGISNAITEDLEDWLLSRDKKFIKAMRGL